MNRLLLKQNIVVVIVTAFFVLVPLALANAMVVVFEQDPLFNDTNLAPGNSITRTVSVTNDNLVAEAVYFDTKEESSNGLAEVMHLEVESGATVYYQDYFSNLFTASEISLGTLAPNETKVYSFTAHLESTTNDTYQNKTMGFDLCVGFSGGLLECDSGVTDSGSSSGGGGGGGSLIPLNIFNETVAAVDVVNQDATITWETNRDATTYLVCGDVANGPFNLSVSEPFLGYEFDVSEVDNDMQEHTAVVSVGSGTYECRPVGRRNLSDDFTTGDTVTFTMPGGEVEGASISTLGTGNTSPEQISLGEADGSVLGVSASSSTSTSEETEQGASSTVAGIMDSVADAVSAASEGDTEDGPLCLFVWLLLLLGLSLVSNIASDAGRVPRNLFASSVFRQGVFSLGYLVCLGLGFWFGVLDTIWWLFVLAWLGVNAIDYKEHYQAAVYNAITLRNFFYLFGGLLLVATSLVFNLPCVWWPFAGVSLLAAILLLKGYGREQ